MSCSKTDTSVHSILTKVVLEMTKKMVTRVMGMMKRIVKDY